MTRDELLQEVASRLFEWRTGRYPIPRQKDVAEEMLGISERTYQRYERGESLPRSWDELERIFRRLGIECSDLRAEFYLPAAAKEEGGDLSTLLREMNELRSSLDGWFEALDARLARCEQLLPRPELQPVE